MARAQQAVVISRGIEVVAWREAKLTANTRSATAFLTRALAASTLAALLVIELEKKAVQLCRVVLGKRCCKEGAWQTLVSVQLEGDLCVALRPRLV